MKRRIIAASAAVVVAMISAVLLLRYVAEADHRAMAGMTLQQVLVVTAPIPEGTAANQIAESVTKQELPAKTVVDGAVTDLSELSGLVTSTELQPGEQVLAARFIDPETHKKAHASDVPKGFSEVSVLLEPQRVVGNDLGPGDRVGVYISLGENVGEGRTHLTLHKTLVTRVQGITAGQAAESTDGETSNGKPVPEGSLLVTVAVSAEDAEQLIFAAEYGRIWMSLENEESTNKDTRLVTEKDAQK